MLPNWPLIQHSNEVTEESGCLELKIHVCIAAHRCKGFVASKIVLYQDDPSRLQLGQVQGLTLRQSLYPAFTQKSVGANSIQSRAYNIRHPASMKDTDAIPLSRAPFPPREPSKSTSHRGTETTKAGPFSQRTADPFFLSICAFQDVPDVSVYLIDERFISLAIISVQSQHQRST